MSTDTFKALVLDQQEGTTHSAIRQLAVGALPEGEVLVRVAYSDLNFKDGLAITGRGKVVRSFPMVPGIDLAGTVEESAAPAYKPGDQVVLTCWVGGAALGGLIPALANNSSGAACGNAGGADLHPTVFPFILRGVNLLGILSVNVPFERRRAVWDRLARDLPVEALDRMIRVAPLEELPALSQAICDGQVRGRVVIDMNA